MLRSRPSSSRAPARRFLVAPTSRSSAPPKPAGAQPVSVIAVENSAKPVVAAIHSVCHGRRAGAGPGLPLPHCRPGCTSCAARSQAGPDARRWRHAAPAPRAGRGSRAEHDRQRRARQERNAGHAARPEAVRQDGGLAESLAEEALALAAKHADAAPLPLVRNLPCKHPWAMRTSSLRATWSRAWPRTSLRPPSAWTPWKPPPEEVCRWHGCSSASIFINLMWTPECRAAPPVCGRACCQQDP
jgi:3-hydroxyacyl-CoA dehydrogenase